MQTQLDPSFVTVVQETASAAVAAFLVLFCVCMFTNENDQ